MNGGVGGGGGGGGGGGREFEIGGVGGGYVKFVVESSVS